MRSTLFVLSAAAAALSTTASAQAQSRAARPTRVERDGAPAPAVAKPVRLAVRTPDDPADPLAPLGIAAATSGGERDTLGLLISTVTPGGPADRAGVDAGSRLAEVNGVSLRSSGDDGSTDAMSRRVAHALGATKPGGDVSLRLYRAGRFRVVTVTPPATMHVAPADVPNAATAAATTAASEPRLTLAPVPVPVSAPVSAPTRAEPVAAVATTPAVVVTAATAAGTATLASVIESTVQTQAQLGRLVAQEEAVDGPLLDSLALMQQELRSLQRRLRGLQARNAHSATARAGTDASAAADADVPLEGLKVGAVSDELVAYYGEGSDAGLLVLSADAAWAPLHAGDVILKVNDAPATTGRLSSAFTAGGRLDVLRRRRTVSVTLPPRE